MTTKKQLFNNLLDELKNNQEVCEEFKYIGTGNPLSNILIIGKEAAINIDSDQHKREIINNFSDWRSLKDFNSDNIKEKDIQNYSPLYPYKGQIFWVDTKKIKKGGTSKTWYNYQKLINFIFNVSNDQIINFHENSFITEVNSTSSEKTIEAIKDSIPFRKKHIISSEYFQSFPIVIISGVGYFENINDNNEIEKIFKVNFIEKKYANKERESQPYWVHFNEEKTKIVINTNQLSIGISDILLEKVAEEIIKSKLL